MNLLQPIPNAEFQLATASVVILLIIVLLFFAFRMFKLIDEIRNDQANSHNALINRVMKDIQSNDKDITSLSSDVQAIKKELYRPLYEVGNTVWYNRALKSEGVSEDFKGVIVSIERADGEPTYIVDSNEDRTAYRTVPQSIITAWTN